MLRKAAADCGVDPRAVTVSVVALDGLRMPEGGRMPVVRPLLAVNADRSVAPASTAKLVTTLAGLELLGADWKWRTGFYAKARPDAEGRVNGIWLRGGGDPTLVAEKFGLLVERMAQMGVRRIEGDLTVDRSYFDLPEGDPSAFDGRGSRPYNQLPDAAVAGALETASLLWNPGRLGKFWERIVMLSVAHRLAVRFNIGRALNAAGMKGAETGANTFPTAGSQPGSRARFPFPADRRPSAWCPFLRTNTSNVSSGGTGSATGAPGRDTSPRGACPKAP